MNIDHKLSRVLFETTKRSWLLRPLAIFCATTLLFIMMTVVVMIGTGYDPMIPMVQRFVPFLMRLVFLILVVWAVTFFIQNLVRRPRPFKDDQGRPLIMMVWEGFSFPSAHASLAFALALVGTLFAPELYGPWLWVGAALVAWGRVAVGVHYVSDVIVGAVVGLLVSWASTIVFGATPYVIAIIMLALGYD